MESGAVTPGRMKRMRNVLTIEKKLEIISEIKKGATASSLRRIFNIPRATMNDLKKQADEIEKFASQMKSLDGRARKRKTMKKAANEALDTALYLWFLKKRNEGVTPSGPIIAEKALFFNEKLNGEKSFKASTGWLNNFKNRHGLRELKIEGDKLSAASIDIVKDFKIKFQKIIDENNFTRDQVYNADESSLNYKALPTKTLASFSEKYAPGFKKQKQRITAMVCANASGKNRIPLLLIGTAIKPRCFKGMNMNALPCTYEAQKSALMTSEIFTRWFKKVRNIFLFFPKW